MRPTLEPGELEMTNALIESEATLYLMRKPNCSFADWLAIRDVQSSREATLLERLTIPTTIITLQ